MNKPDHREDKRVTSVLLACLSLLLTCGVSGMARAQSAPPSAESLAHLKKTLQEKLDAWHKAGRFPGATIGVALPDGTTFGLAVGISDTERQTAMKPSNRLLQGSVGKTYVAAVALQLVQEKRLGLDDRIEKYLGRESWFPRLPNGRDITVRMLMNHTSGLVRYEFREQFTKDLTANPDKVWQPAELVAYILDTKPPFPAGTSWDYSDTNYIVLGMIIERITGIPYYEEVRKRILKPLKLNDTIPSDSRVIAGLVQGYAGPNNHFGGTDAMIQNGKFAINPQFEWCGGGMASTSEDLVRWAKALYEGTVLDAPQRAEMRKGISAPLGPNAQYGLGVIIRQTPLGISYGHSGFFPGYMTDMMYLPDHRIAVAVQVNTSVPRNLGKPLSRLLVELAEAVTKPVP